MPNGDGYTLVINYAYLAKKLFLEKKIKLVDFRPNDKEHKRTAFVFLFENKEQADETVQKSLDEIRKRKENNNGTNRD